MDGAGKDAEKLEKLRFEWEKIYHNGGPPGCEVSDGFLLNRIRQEMVDLTERMEKEGTRKEAEYRMELPKRVKEGYMAREAEIRSYATALLEQTAQRETYRELVQLKKRMEDEGIAVSTGGRESLMDRIAHAIEQNDLCLMRNLSCPERLQEQIEEEWEGLQRLIQKRRKRQKRMLARGQIDGQYSIYDLLA